jgi:tetratricopeptide (TPR) repeat protein
MIGESTAAQHGPTSAVVLICESQPGDARDEIVEAWLAERRHRSHGPAVRVSCDPRSGGIWAGLRDLLESLVPAIRARAPELLACHGRELCLVVPSLRSELDFPESLTDTVQHEEKTRNYPADRAYRCLHGLIDLLAEWHELMAPGDWSIVCDDFDLAGGLVRRFFAQLARRRGDALGLHLLAVVAAGGGADVAAQLEPSTVAASLARSRPAAEPPVADPEAMTQIALELERQREEGTLGDEDLPRLIDAWERSSAPERALRWQVCAMSRYNHLGLYETSLPYASAVQTGLGRLRAEEPELYPVAISLLFFCYVPLGRAHEVRPVLEEALELLKDPSELAHTLYLLAMLHARFLEPANQALADEYLHRALSVLSDGELPESERAFLTVFMMNGLALVRLRQRRVADALALCAEGIARLNEHLGPNHHRLHRSVLLFNIAQVHAQIGPYETAIDYFTQAMALDPNYSEYYNDRGAVHFKLGKFKDAERDYLRAIELSPPYAEVWTNLGQCYRSTERMEDAATAYSRAIDLEPGATLPLIGRAEANAALGHAERALQDYDRALAIDSGQPLVLASRAVLHYEAGRLGGSLADLDAAIALAPDLAELYQNRAVALRDLGRPNAAAGDLIRYLELSPDAEDREDVQATVAEWLAA